MSGEGDGTGRGGGVLERRIGLFDATTAVIGGIVGAGIFMNPAAVARIVTTPALILGAWLLGGLVALAGAWVYAELGSTRPAPGGQYAYFHEAFHPLVAFLYGWGLLWVIQSGGMAAVAVTFARYAGMLTGWTGHENLLATGALALLTAVNCLGVRAGASTQSLFTVLKGLAIAALVVCGIAWAGSAAPAGTSTTAAAANPVTLPVFGSALVPVLFAYGGWQTACFLAGEVREPHRTLPRALMLGIAAVITLYLAVNVVCLRSLGPEGLAATKTPASDVMQRAFGDRGAQFIAAGIVISTFGFLSQGMLTTPRVYFAMARDGLFFRGLGQLHPATKAPVPAVLLQGIVAAAIAWSGQYERILNYVVSVDFVFYGLAALCVFRFRAAGETPPFRTPGHPFTTIFFIVVCWLVVANLAVQQPADSLKGLGILLAGIPVYFIWARRAR